MPTVQAVGSVRASGGNSRSQFNVPIGLLLWKVDEVARYRNVHVKIWGDGDFQKMTPRSKLVFLYLLTTPELSESGIFVVTYKTIADNTGIPEKEIPHIITKLKNIYYDKGTDTVFVVKHLVYNLGGNPEVKVNAVRIERETTHTPLWAVFDEVYELSNENKYIFKGSLTVNQPLSITITKPITKPITKIGLKDKGIGESEPETEPDLYLYWKSLTPPNGNLYPYDRPNLKSINDATKFRLKLNPDEEKVKAVINGYNLILGDPNSFWGGKNQNGKPIRITYHEFMRGTMKGFTYWYDRIAADMPIEDKKDPFKGYNPLAGYEDVAV